MWYTKIIKERKTYVKKVFTISSLVAVVLGVLAIVLCTLPGYTLSSSVSDPINYSMFQLMFGCKVTFDSNGNQVANAGLIIALILAILGIIAVVFGFLTFGNKKLKNVRAIVALVGTMCFIATGVLFFLTKNLTGLSTGSVDVGPIISGEASFGVGVYLTGILAILAGICAVPGILAPMCKKCK